MLLILPPQRHSCIFTVLFNLCTYGSSARGVGKIVRKAKPHPTHGHSLWRHALAPLGIDLFREVMIRIEQRDLPKTEQEPWAATREPALRPKEHYHVVYCTIRRQSHYCWFRIYWVFKANPPEIQVAPHSL